MSSPTVNPVAWHEASAYATAVRRQLDDLAPDVVEELTGGLEADLLDQAAESTDPLAGRLGDPAGYAAELRAAAGLAPRTAPPRSPGAVANLRRQIDRDLDGLRRQSWWPRGVRHRAAAATGVVGRARLGGVPAGRPAERRSRRRRAVVLRGVGAAAGVRRRLGRARTRPVVPLVGTPGPAAARQRVRAAVPAACAGLGRRRAVLRRLLRLRPGAGLRAGPRRRDGHQRLPLRSGRRAAGGRHPARPGRRPAGGRHADALPGGDEYDANGRIRVQVPNWTEDGDQTWNVFPMGTALVDAEEFYADWYSGADTPGSALRPPYRSYDEARAPRLRVPAVLVDPSRSLRSTPSPRASESATTPAPTTPGAVVTPPATTTPPTPATSVTPTP